MSSKPVKKEKVRKVLEDTGFAYTLSCESQHINSDYADYASTQALASFQRALKDPHLTYDDLCAILRKASSRASSRQCKTPWSMFMANYIAKHCGDHQNQGKGRPH
ncbi:MAG: hypothetical protein R3D88_04465 [Alphaproteobacteria bacterium]|jgi:hypothetical protein|nr:hypothetical protein [Alphaproteobacteria bacterium]